MRKYRILWVLAAVMTAFSACGQADNNEAAEMSGTEADIAAEADKMIADTAAEAALERMPETVMETIPTAGRPVPETAPVTCPPCTCTSCTCMSADTEDDSRYEEEYVGLWLR